MLSTARMPSTVLCTCEATGGKRWREREREHARASRRAAIFHGFVYETEGKRCRAHQQLDAHRFASCGVVRVLNYVRTVTTQGKYTKRKQLPTLMHVKEL